ncbi:MAG: PQQ-dependent sugar dehydrogenase [Gaiellales bacterium]
MRIITAQYLLVLVAVFALAGCGSDSPAPAPSPQKAPGAAVEPGPLAIDLVEVGRFDTPVHAVAVPGTGQIAVVEKGGRILAVSGMQCDGVDGCPAQPVSKGRVLLDISDQVSSGGEQGLLGLAFHPGWPKDPRLFINYTDRDGATHVESWTMAGAGAPARRQRELLKLEQPYANHNGGHLQFGPDGLLYVGTGDGGSGGDPQDRAQNPEVLLGKMLRFDVADAGAAGAPEVWAIGLRNPWRYSFDATTGDLWIGDVGQSTFEEIDVLSADQISAVTQPNFEWRLREGFAKFNDSGRTGPGERIAPVLTYGRDHGCSITGGVVYRGALVPKLVGSYLFADFCERDIRILDADGVPGATFEEGELKWQTAPGADQIVSFAEVQDQEVLAVSLDGTIHQVVPG